MVKRYEEYDDIINCSSIPADFREMFEENVDEDDLDEPKFIVVTPEWVEEYNTSRQVRESIANYYDDIMVVCVHNFGGVIIFGNSDDVIAEL